MFVPAIDSFSKEASKVTSSQLSLSFEGQEAPAIGGQASTTFIEMVNGIIDDYDRRINLTTDMLYGKDVDVHALMIAQAQVDMVSNLASTVATKVATAYQTLMNMQV